jgi:hypothetical protein
MISFISINKKKKAKQNAYALHLTCCVSNGGKKAGEKKERTHSTQLSKTVNHITIIITIVLNHS